jgi:hypothetical protein
MKINSVFDSSIENLDIVGIGIQSVSSNNNEQHVGVLYRNNDNKIKLLHLAFHKLLREDDFSDQFLWVDISLDKANKMHFATICQLIINSNQNGIPYGLGVDDSKFGNQGQFTPAGEFAGLTCATFIMQLFHSQGFYIVDIEKWKKRKSDKKWQIQIMQRVEKYIKDKGLTKPYTSDFINYQKRLIRNGSARYKPEEVTAAAALENPPHDFHSIRPHANQILNQLNEHNKQLANNRASFRLLQKNNSNPMN